jgi:cytochrome c
MNIFHEWYKVAAGLLGAMLFAIGLGYVSDAIYSKPPPPRPEHAAAAPAAAAPQAKADEPQAPPIAERMAKADPAKGEALFKKNCTSCHGAEQGGANKVGPNLYGVVGRKIAGHEGFAYSDALKGKGGEWSYDLLDQWIANPRSVAAGNKMTYAGERDPAARADLIAWLRMQAATPAPLPAK